MMRNVALMGLITWTVAAGVSSAATSEGNASCWRRIQYVTGRSFNPNKFAAIQAAKDNYVREARGYARYCPEADGCRLSYPPPSTPTCLQTGSNWNCHVTNEIRCTKPDSARD